VHDVLDVPEYARKQVCQIVPGQRVKKLDPQQASQVGLMAVDWTACLMLPLFTQPLADQTLALAVQMPKLVGAHDLKWTMPCTLDMLLHTGSWCNYMAHLICSATAVFACRQAQHPTFVNR
jgi:hypothetical protein